MSPEWELMRIYEIVVHVGGCVRAGKQMWEALVKSLCYRGQVPDLTALFGGPQFKELAQKHFGQARIAMHVTP